MKLTFYFAATLCAMTLFDQQWQISVAEAKDRRLRITKFSEPGTAVCNKEIITFDTTTESISQCILMCVDDGFCVDVDYDVQEYTCTGFRYHPRYNEVACASNTSVTYYVKRNQCKEALTTYSYIGCYKDSDPRVFPSYYVQWTNMSIDVCYDFCKSIPPPCNRYFGTQFSTSCFCGDANTNYSLYGRADEASCNSRCRGNTSQFCGAGYHNSVYAIISG